MSKKKHIRKTEDRKGKVFDRATDDFLGIMNGEEITERFSKEQIRDGLIYILCAGVVDGKSCNCRMHVGKREDSVAYLVGKHIIDCPSGSAALKKLREELTDIIDIDPAGFLSNLLASKNKKYLPKEKVTEPARPVPASVCEEETKIPAANLNTSDYIRLAREEIAKAIEMKTLVKSVEGKASTEPDSDSHAEMSDSMNTAGDSAPITLGSGAYESYDRKHHEKHATVRRRPKGVVELFIQYILFSSLREHLPGSDSMHFFDVLFLPETKDIFRDRYNAFGFTAFVIATRTWDYNLASLVEKDEGVKAALNPDCKPCIALEDPFKTSYQWDDEKNEMVFHNDERLIMYLTFESIGEKEEYEKRFIGSFKTNKKTGEEEWKKSRNEKKPRLILAEWDSVYDGFVDVEGNSRRIVHAHIMSSAKQIALISDNEIYEQIFGEND